MFCSVTVSEYKSSEVFGSIVNKLIELGIREKDEIFNFDRLLCDFLTHGIDTIPSRSIVIEFYTESLIYLEIPPLENQEISKEMEVVWGNMRLLNTLEGVSAKEVCLTSC